MMRLNALALLAFWFCCLALPMASSEAGDSLLIHFRGDFLTTPAGERAQLKDLIEQPLSQVLREGLTVYDALTAAAIRPYRKGTVEIVSGRETRSVPYPRPENFDDAKARLRPGDVLHFFTLKY